MVKMPRFAITALAFQMATSEASSQLASQVQLELNSNVMSTFLNWWLSFFSFTKWDGRHFAGFEVSHLPHA